MLIKGDIMAEFCLDCWNKMNESEDSEEKYILSKDLDLCEGCGQWKPVIIMERRAYYMYQFRYLLFPFKMVYYVIYFLWRLFLLPYLLFVYHKSKNTQE